MDYNCNKEYFKERDFIGEYVLLIGGALIFLYGLITDFRVTLWGLAMAGGGAVAYRFKKSVKPPTDSGIDQICIDQIRNFKETALAKLGLDEDQITEATPIQFDGYYDKRIHSACFYKIGGDRRYRTSNYEAVIFFFSVEQVYCYTYRFSIIANEKQETTDEYFYRDIVSVSTASDTKTYKNARGKQETANYEYFTLTTSGGTTITAAIRNIGDADRAINGMKSLLRNKKQQLKN